MKKSIFAVVMALTIALTLLSSVLVVYATPIVSAGTIAPSGNENYIPTSGDFTTLYGSDYYEIVFGNDRPLSITDIRSGGELTIWGRIRNNGRYGYKLYYGSDTDNLVLVHQDNSDAPSGSLYIANPWTLDSTAIANVSGVQDGKFYLKSYGNSAGECCITGYIATVADPPEECNSDTIYTGIQGRIYKLVDFDYSSIVDNTKYCLFNVAVPCELIYTDSAAEDSTGNYTVIKSFSSSGSHNVTSEDLETFTAITGRYFALSFGSNGNGTFAYYMKDTETGTILDAIGDFFITIGEGLETWLHVAEKGSIISWVLSLEPDPSDPDRFDGLTGDYSNIFNQFKQILDPNSGAVSVLTTIYAFPWVLSFIILVVVLILVVAVFRLFLTL